MGGGSGIWLRWGGGVSFSSMPSDYAAAQAEIRKQCAPDPGDHRGRWVPCVDCGAQFWDWTEKWRRYCADCGAERQRRQWYGDPEGRAAAYAWELREWITAWKADLDRDDARAALARNLGDVLSSRGIASAAPSLI